MTEQTAETANPSNKNDEKAKADRDLFGRFMAGNPGGPGNPYNRQTALFKKAIQSATTPEEAKALARKIYDMAMEGNLAAAKVYFTYTVGKPDNPIDPDRMDVHEIEIYRDTAPLKTEMGTFLAAGKAETSLHVVRTLQPLAAAMQQQQIAGVFNRKAESPEARQKQEAEKSAKVQEKLNSPGPELPDGLEQKLWPTANGVNPEELPSALNGYGDRPPANGVNRPGKRKKKRKGPAAPTTNGRFHFEPNGRA
jgi:hypothetical protein